MLKERQPQQTLQVFMLEIVLFLFIHPTPPTTTITKGTFHSKDNPGIIQNITKIMNSGMENDRLFLLGWHFEIRMKATGLNMLHSLFLLYDFNYFF